MRESRLKLAFLGCGGIARQHWRGIQGIATRVDVVACIDINEDAAADMARETGGAAFTTFELANKNCEFDAVDIMLPHNRHEDAVLDCFSAGKHVLLEKPIAHTLESCERILTEASKADKVFMIAEQAQYWPDIIKARELIDENAIGRPLMASGNFYDRTFVPEDGSIPWRFKKDLAGGGVTMDGGAHWIRPLRMMMGEIEEVIGVIGNHIPQMETESFSQVLIRFAKGTTGVLTCMNVTAAAAPVDMFRITGTEGELVITGGPRGKLILYNTHHRKGHAVMDAVEGKRASYGAEIKDFSEAVLDGKPFAAPPEYALGELRTALALYRSVESRSWEKVW